MLAQEQNIDNRQVPVSLRKQKRQVLLSYGREKKCRKKFWY